MHRDIKLENMCIEAFNKRDPNNSLLTEDLKIIDWGMATVSWCGLVVHTVTTMMWTLMRPTACSEPAPVIPSGASCLHMLQHADDVCTRLPPQLPEDYCDLDAQVHQVLQEMEIVTMTVLGTPLMASGETHDPPSTGILAGPAQSHAVGMTIISMHMPMAIEEAARHGGNEWISQQVMVGRMQMLVLQGCQMMLSCTCLVLQCASKLHEEHAAWHWCTQMSH